jgi:hypothetical protein
MSLASEFSLALNALVVTACLFIEVFMLQPRLGPRTMCALLVVVLVVATVHPRDTYAAQDAPDLVVSLLDEYDHGVPATIIVCDIGGERDLARATTDAEGRATITTLLVHEVRVAVEGSLSNRRHLFQRGDDVKGIYILLNAGSTRLDLRVDPDGAVAPDPATMVAQEGTGYASAALPTAPVAAQVIDVPTSIQPTKSPPSAVPQ